MRELTTSELAQLLGEYDAVLETLSPDEQRLFHPWAEFFHLNAHLLLRAQ